MIKNDLRNRILRALEQPVSIEFICLNTAEDIDGFIEMSHAVKVSGTKEHPHRTALRRACQSATNDQEFNAAKLDLNEWDALKALEESAKQ